MSIRATDIQKISFQFRTGGLPPPFSHRYDIVVDLSPKRATVHIDLQYTDREDLTNEEIYDEGFTLEDDFKWSGDFPEVWRAAIVDKAQGGNLSKKPEVENGPELYLEVIENSGKQHAGYILEIDPWVRFLQEIIQAAMEMSEREHPLVIRYISDSDETLVEKTIRLTFADRSAEVLTPGPQSIIDWKRGADLMKNVFALDYDLDRGSSKTPRGPGRYIDTGEGNWYNLDKHVHSPTNRRDLVAALIERLEGL